jgi:hypothetical protein
MVLFIALATIVFAFLCAVYLLYRWLNARGEFMLLDATVGITGTFKENFRRHPALANNLFKFRIYWDLAIFNYYLIAVVIGALFVIPDFKPMFAGDPYRFSGWSITAIAVTAALFLLSLPLLWFFSNLFFHLAVPIMYVRGVNAWPAFKAAWSTVFRPFPAGTLLFFLLNTVTGFAEGVGAMIGMFALFLCTCCLAVVVSLIPVLGSVVLYASAAGALPAMVFRRAYSLLFLSQVGPDFQIAWQAPAATGFPVELHNPAPGASDPVNTFNPPGAP